MQQSPNAITQPRNIAADITNGIDVTTGAIAKYADINALIANGRNDIFTHLSDLNKINNETLNLLVKDLTLFVTDQFTQETICCLIKNLILMLKSGTWVRSQVAAMHSRNKELKTKWEEFLDLLDTLVFIIDTIILLLQWDIKDFVMPILDISAMILDGIMGAILICLQQILYTIKDSLVNLLTDEISQNMEKVPGLAKCFDFIKLITIIRRYVGDFGMLNKLFNFLKTTVTNNWKATFNKWNSEKQLENLKMIKLLKSVRALLLKIKQAAINFDSCVFPDTLLDMNDNLASQASASGGSNGGPWRPDANGGRLDNLNAFVADDGTILKNSDVGGADGNILESPSSSDINALLKSRFGLPASLADLLTGFTASPDHVQGTMSDNAHMTGNDCGYVMNAQKLTDSVLKRIGLK